MLPKEILNEIIHAEHVAQGIYNDALRSQADFDDFLKKRSDELRAQYYERAERELADFEAEITRGSEAELATLNANLQRELDHVRELFEMRRDEIVEHLFESVVGADD